MATPIPVLVIDDEAAIRSVIQRMLEAAACRVLEAEDAEAGLRLIERGDPPQAVHFSRPPRRRPGDAPPRRDPTAGPPGGRSGGPPP